MYTNEELKRIALKAIASKDEERVLEAIYLIAYNQPELFGDALSEMFN